MKLITSFVVVAFLLTPSLQQCSTKTDSVTIFPTTDETLNWNLFDDFFSGAGLKFTLSDTLQTQFKIFDPVENTGGHTTHTATKIVSSRALTSNKYWVNSFVFLNKEATQISLSVAVGEVGQMTIAPNFDQIIKVDDIADGLDCYDLEYVAADAYIVDCSKTINKVVKNTLYYVTSTSSDEYLVEDALVPAHQGHLLGQYTVKGQGTNVFKYLVRATPSYSVSTDGSMAGDSLIEVYLLNDAGQPSNTGYVLDAVTMSQILGADSDLEFNIVDMKVLDNGDIYLLDAQFGIYVINFIPNGQFTLKKQIDIGMGYAYAFDRNIFIRRDGRYSENIAVLGYGFIELIVDGKLSAQYKLPAGITYTFPSYIDLSQEFVVFTAQDSTFLFDIDSKSKDLLQMQTVPHTDYVLINPFLPDMIVLTLEGAYRYTLSQGYLQYKGKADLQERKALDVIATNGLGTCKVTVNYQIIASNDRQLYQYDTNPAPFPSSITEDAEPFQLNMLSSGPNEQYRQVKALEADDTSVQISINSFWQLQFPNELPKDLKFEDVLVGKDSTYFYMAQQDANGKLTVVKATHASIYSAVATQEKIFDTVNVGSTLTKTTFQMWECDCPMFHFAYVENNKVYLKVVKDNKVEDIATIPFTSDVKILFLQNYLYMLSNGIVQAYTPHGDYVQQVNVDLLKTQGYTKTWNPVKIFGNRKLKENLVFVVHTDHITLLDFHTQFTFIKAIDTASPNVELAIGSETFFIVSDTIVEYDYDRLNNIFKTKNVQLYNYELVQPLLGDFCSDTGYLYVVAKDKPAPTNEDVVTNYYVLTIIPDALQHDALFKAIKVDQPSLIATQGTAQQMYIYVQTAAGGAVYSLLTNPVMIIEPTINDPQFASAIKLELDVFNYDDTTSIKIKQDVSVINTQTKVYIDAEKFKNKNSLEIQKDEVKVTTKSLGTDWYSGQIAEIKIDCKQCGKGKGIEITQLVQPSDTPLFPTYEIRSALGNMFQATKALIFVKDDDTLENTIVDLDYPSDEYACFQATQTDAYILSLCYDGTQYTVYATSTLSLTGYFPVGEVLQLGTSAQKIEFLKNDILLILDGSSLRVSTINMDIVDQWVLDDQYTVNLEKLQIPYPDLTAFTPNDFIVLTVNKVGDKQYYKIVISSGQGLLIVDFYYDDIKFSTPQLQLVDLSAELIKNKQYAVSSTSYMQVKELSAFADNTLHLFIQTSNVVHYGINVKFAVTQGQDYLSYASIEVQFLLNRYGTWKTLNHVAINDKYAAIPYYNAGKVVVAVYPITQSTKPTTIIGSYIWSDDNPVKPLGFGLFFRANKLYGTTSIAKSSLFTYQFNTEPILTFTNTKVLPLEDQTITITPRNDFYSADSQFTLKVKSTPVPPPGPGPNPDDPGDSSNLWWILLVSIGGGLLVIGGIGFLIYKMKQKGKENPEDYDNMA